MKLSDIKSATHGKFQTQENGVFVELELSKVYPNPNQPRKDFSNIEELAATIKEDGLLQPIVVLKDKGGLYMVIAGERRYRACKHLNNTTIKAHIIIADDKKVQELALVENIQRDDLTDFEKAKYINQLWASGHYDSKKELATTIGKSQSYLSKVFKAVNLCDEIIVDIEDNKRDIGLEILQELSSIKDESIQLEVYQRNPTREQIRNIIYMAKENKKYQKLVVPTVSPAKFKKVMTMDNKDTHNVVDFLSGLPLDKQYKITIEEL